MITPLPFVSHPSILCFTLFVSHSPISFSPSRYCSSHLPSTVTFIFSLACFLFLSSSCHHPFHLRFVLLVILILLYSPLFTVPPLPPASLLPPFIIFSCSFSLSSRHPSFILIQANSLTPLYSPSFMIPFASIPFSLPSSLRPSSFVAHSHLLSIPFTFLSSSLLYLVLSRCLLTFIPAFSAFFTLPFFLLPSLFPSISRSFSCVPHYSSSLSSSFHLYLYPLFAHPSICFS